MPCHSPPFPSLEPCPPPSRPPSSPSVSLSPLAGGSLPRCAWTAVWLMYHFLPLTLPPPLRSPLCQVCLDGSVALTTRTSSTPWWGCAR